MKTINNNLLLQSLCFLSKISYSQNNIDNDDNDTGIYNYDNGEYDDDYSNFPLKPTQIQKSTIMTKNARKSNKFPTIPPVEESPSSSPPPTTSFIQKTCFVGESVTFQGSPVKNWIVVKWNKNKLSMNPTIGAIQTWEQGEITPFKDFDKSVYDIPKNSPTDLIIKKCDFQHSGVYQMIYTTSNGDQTDQKEFELKVFQKPSDIIVEKDGDWKNLGYIEENNDDFVNLAHCVSTSLPKSEHVWIDQEGVKYSAKNVQEKIDEITKSVTVISSLELKPDRSLAGKKFTCKINYPESSENYSKTILDALDVQYKPDTPEIRLENDDTEENSKFIVCQADANPDAVFEFTLIQPDGTEEIFGEAKISSSDAKILNLQTLDESVEPDIHGVSTYSKIKCQAKNSRGRAEVVQDLRDILNPKKAGFFNETYNKALIWIGSQDPVIRYGIIGGFALFLALICLISICICRRSRSRRPENFNSRDPENKALKDFRDFNTYNPNERGDYTVDKNEFNFQFNRAGSTASNRTTAASVKRRIHAHKNANEFDSGDEDDGVGGNDTGFTDPMSNGVDHVNLQPPPPGPQPVGINQYGIQGSNI